MNPISLDDIKLNDEAKMLYSIDFNNEKKAKSHYDYYDIIITNKIKKGNWESYRYWI